MLSYHTLKDKPRVLRPFTSLERDEFETLLIPFEQAWNASVTNPLRHKKARKRGYGGGRKPHLVAIEDKLFFILFYVKVYPLQEVIAAFFGMSQG
jgi:hypothetical protein